MLKYRAGIREPNIRHGSLSGRRCSSAIPRAVAHSPKAPDKVKSNKPTFRGFDDFQLSDKGYYVSPDSKIDEVEEVASESGAVEARRAPVTRAGQYAGWSDRPEPREIRAADLAGAPFNHSTQDILPTDSTVSDRPSPRQVLQLPREPALHPSRQVHSLRASGTPMTTVSPLPKDNMNPSPGPLESVKQPIARLFSSLLSCGAAQMKNGSNSRLGFPQVLDEKGDQVELLKEQADVLEAQNAELSARNKDLNRRLELSSQRTTMLQNRLDINRALGGIDAALQKFRRNTLHIPPQFDLSTFYERESDIVGEGGCAKVFAWHNAGREWVVKSDLINVCNRTGGLELERCGDLMPAMMPPHPNIQAPVAWSVGTASGERIHDNARLQLAFESTQQPASGAGAYATPPMSFRLYTVYERFHRDLFDHSVHLRRSAELEGGVGDTGMIPLGLMDEQCVLRVVRDVAAALEHLGQHNVAHCDVKPQNVMLQLNEQGEVSRAVLIDYGLARVMTPGVEHVEARGGSWLYKAPEQLRRPNQAVKPYVRRETDMWALGALICYMVRGILPTVEGFPAAEQADEVLNWGFRPTKDGHQVGFHMLKESVLPPELGEKARSSGESEISASVSPSVMKILRELAEACLRQDPAKRPTPSEVKLVAHSCLGSLAS